MRSVLPRSFLAPWSRHRVKGMADWNVIMVVDDEEDSREPLATMLESAGYGVLQAANGADALHLLAVEPCDVIVLDLLMPVMNGWAFRQNQRANAAFAKIPVLLMSAAHRLEEAARALKAAACVPKPIDTAHLLKALCRITGRSEA